MRSRTHKIKRRLAVIALAASVAAVAIPAAQARHTPVDGWFPQNGLADDWFRDVQVKTLGSQDPRAATQEVLGDASFGIQALNSQDMIKSAALEHGAAGFENVFLGQTRTAARHVIAPDYSHLPEGDRPSGTAFGA